MTDVRILPIRLFVCLGLLVGPAACTAQSDDNVGCSEESDCPQGYSCFTDEGVCLPTGSFYGSTCRDDVANACTQGLRCSNTAGRVCIGGCVEESDCPEGFSCFTQEGACLPTGTFPGSACRPDGADACDQDFGGVSDADMACVAGRCKIDCAADTTVCGRVDDAFRCSAMAGNGCVPKCDEDGSCPEGFSCFATENVCLPTGTYPGSACRPDTGDACDQDLSGQADADMSCNSGRCEVSCASDATVCERVRDDLACSAAAGNFCGFGCGEDGSCPEGFACFTSENVCLPTGSYPGSTCRPHDDACDQDLGGKTDADMGCISGRCELSCASDASVCGRARDGLACSALAGQVCAFGCQEESDCPEGFSCYTQEGACLPTGSFPGGICRTDVGDACDQDLFGIEEIDMECSAEKCVVDCTEGGDFLCRIFDDDFVCSTVAGSICVQACDEGFCSDGMACFDDENACLPPGTFLDSPCGPGDSCGRIPYPGDPTAEIQLTCSSLPGTPTCLADCTVGSDPLCTSIDPALKCFDPGDASPRVCRP